MEIDVYKILNEVEIDINAYEKEEFTDIEKRKFKNNFKKSIKKNNSIYKKCALVASIALLIIGLSTTNLGNNVLAYANMISYDIASYLGIEKSLDEYKTVVNQSITKNGVTIKLNEVVLDTDQLVVSTTITANEKIGQQFIRFDSNIYVNGKSMYSGASGSAKRIDEYTIEEVMFYDLEDDLSDDLNIKVVFSNPHINGNTRSGRWVFEFKSNGNELALDTKKILLNTSFKLNDGQKITLEKYTSNNLGQKIYSSMYPKGTNYDIVLRGHDDLENKVGFYLSRVNGRNGIFKLTTINGNLNENAKALYLTPYAVKLPDKSGKLSNDFKKVGEEFTIDLLIK